MTTEPLPEELEPAESETPRLRGPWWFGGRRRLTEEQRESLLSQLFFEGGDRAQFLGRFTVLLTLSVLIAVFGLAENSAAVVIGAMLISPLATPLLGLSAALVMGWPRRQLETAAIVAGGTAGAVALACLVLWILPEPREITLASEQLLDRTEPRLLDLGVAIVAGAAGAYVLLRREAISALPGVAIAVALVPPLATVGMMLELGEPDLAAKALLLYLTNVAGIVLAGSLVLLFAGVRPETLHGRLTRRARVGVGASVLAVLVVAYPLAVVTNDRIEAAADHDGATAAAREWLRERGMSLLDVEVDGDSVELQIGGPELPRTLDDLADRVADRLDRDVSVTAEWVRQHRIEAEGSP